MYAFTDPRVQEAERVVKNAETPEQLSAAIDAWSDAWRAATKATKVANRGERMNARLERRREAIKERNIQQIKMWALWSIGLPLGIAAAAFAWRLAAWTIFQ